MIIEIEIPDALYAEMRGVFITLEIPLNRLHGYFQEFGRTPSGDGEIAGALGYYVYPDRNAATFIGRKLIGLGCDGLEVRYFEEGAIQTEEFNTPGRWAAVVKRKIPTSTENCRRTILLR